MTSPSCILSRKILMLPITKSFTVRLLSLHPRNSRSLATKALADGKTRSTKTQATAFETKTLGPFRRGKTFPNRWFKGMNESQCASSPFCSLVKPILVFIAIAAILYPDTTAARSDTKNVRLGAASQIYSVIQHGDLGDTAFVTKTFSLREKKEQPGSFEVAGSPNPINPNSVQYSVYGEPVGNVRGALLTIFGPKTCIEQSTLRSVFGEKGRIYRSANSAEREKEIGLFYRYEFDEHAITTQFVYLTGRPCLQSVQIHQLINGGQTTKAAKSPRRLTRNQQIDHLNKILAVFLHEDLKDIDFLQDTLNIPLKRTGNEDSRIKGFGPIEPPFDFNGPWVTYQDRFPSPQMRILYFPNYPCVDMSRIPLVFGRPKKVGDGLPSISEPWHFVKLNSYEYEYVNKRRTALTFISQLDCLAEAKLSQSSLAPHQPKK